MINLSRVHIIIEGHVQGVGFRYYIQEKAIRWNLTGWVRNLDEEKVEILAEGEKTALFELVEAAGKGPSGARVFDLLLEWMEPSGAYRHFMIAPSG